MISGDYWANWEEWGGTYTMLSKMASMLIPRPSNSSDEENAAWIILLTNVLLITFIKKCASARRRCLKRQVETPLAPACVKTLLRSENHH